MGSARPCWWCIEWCRWADIECIFHWCAEIDRFEAVKANDSSMDRYQKCAGRKLFAGTVSVPASFATEFG
jgi:hypothetical protein